MYKKLWYYTENYGTSINEGEKDGRLQKIRNFDILW